MQEPITRRQSLQQPPPTRYRLPTTDDQHRPIYDDVVTDSRMPSSTRRYQQQQPRNVIQVTHHSSIPARQSRIQPTAFQRTGTHWLVYAGGAILLMLLGWTVLTAVSQWWQSTTDTWKYGNPPTYQTDMVVGGDSAAHPTHFLVENLHGSIFVIELHAGNPNKVSVLVGPVAIGSSDEQTPATLQFRDVNGDGKPDLILCVGASRYAYINTGNGDYRLPKPGEAVNL